MTNPNITTLDHANQNEHDLEYSQSAVDGVSSGTKHNVRNLSFKDSRQVTYKSPFDVPHDDNRMGAGYSPSLDVSKLDDMVQTKDLEEVSLDHFQLLTKDDSKMEDENDLIIRIEVEKHRVHEEMLKNKDFNHILARAEELYNIFGSQYPRDKKNDKTLDMIKEILKHLFKNEISLIS